MSDNPYAKFAGKEDNPYAKFSAPQESAVPQENRTEKFLSGVRDPLEGATQFATHLLPEGAQKEVYDFNNWLASKGLPFEKIPEGGIDAFEKQREQGLEKAGAGKGDPYREAGSIAANTAAAVALPELKGGALAQGATLGAAQGLLDPVEQEGSYWANKVKDVVSGAALGATAGKVGDVASGVIAPKLSGAKQALLSKGVELSPNKLLGSPADYFYKAASHFPILRGFVDNEEKRSVESFNKATINQALEPVGAKLEEGTSVGHDALKQAQEKISAAYEHLLPKMSLKIDESLRSQLDTLEPMISEMEPSTQARLKTILDNRVLSKADSAGNISGRSLQDAISYLGNKSSVFKSSSNVDHHELGDALSEVRDHLLDGLQRQNPEQAVQLANARSSYAMLARVEKAASRRADSKAVFTPYDLLQAVKGADKSARDRAYGAGDTLFQKWAEYANDLIPAPKKGMGDGAHADAVMSGLNRYVKNAPGPARAAVGSTLQKGGVYGAPGLADMLSTEEQQ